VVSFVESERLETYDSRTVVRGRVAYSGGLIVAFEKSGIVVNARIWFVMKRDYHANSVIR
jgi:hypothetical protein